MLYVCDYTCWLTVLHQSLELVLGTAQISIGGSVKVGKKCETCSLERSSDMLNT